MSVEIQKADPAARRRAVWISSVVMALGAWAVWWFDRNEQVFLAWLERNADVLFAHPWLAGVPFLIAVLPLLGLCVHLWRLSGRIIAAERYPPPGQKLLRDTRVLHGDKAVARARLMRVGVVVMALVALLLPIGIGWIFVELQASRA